jgi:hypothetical protein
MTDTRQREGARHPGVRRQLDWRYRDEHARDSDPAQGAPRGALTLLVKSSLAELWKMHARRIP